MAYGQWPMANGQWPMMTLGGKGLTLERIQRRREREHGAPIELNAQHASLERDQRLATALNAIAIHAT